LGGFEKKSSGKSGSADRRGIIAPSSSFTLGGVEAIYDRFAVGDSLVLVIKGCGGFSRAQKQTAMRQKTVADFF
jgi:hypothetical protein